MTDEPLDLGPIRERDAWPMETRSRAREDRRLLLAEVDRLRALLGEAKPQPQPMPWETPPNAREGSE